MPSTGTASPPPEQIEAFAHHYVQSFNATDAALAAGLVRDDASSPRASANAYSNLLMMRPDVQRRIRELNDAQLRKVDATAHRTMRELARISYSDIGDLFDDEGRLRDVVTLPRHTRAAIKAVKIERRRVKSGYTTDLNTGKKVPVYEDYETLEIKMHDKVATLGILAKHFKIVGDEADGVNALASALADRLKGARSRVLSSHPPQEIEDARIIHPDVQPQPAHDGARTPVQESGDGDRPDHRGL